MIADESDSRPPGSVGFCVSLSCALRELGTSASLYMPWRCVCVCVCVSAREWLYPLAHMRYTFVLRREDEQSRVRPNQTGAATGASTVGCEACVLWPEIPGI